MGGTVSKEDFDDALEGWGWISWAAWWLAVSVSTLIVGALLVWLAPAALYAAERAVRERLGATIAFGIAIAIGVPLLAILALVTLVGIPFGVALLLAAIPVLVVAYVTSAWILGRLVLRNRSTSPWAALLAGWAILRAAALVPIVGGLVGLAATVLGLGALAVALWRGGRSGAPTATPDTPAPARPAPAPDGKARLARDAGELAACASVHPKRKPTLTSDARGQRRGSRRLGCGGVPGARARQASRLG